MKKIILSILGMAFIIAFLMVSCKKEETKVKSESVKNSYLDNLKNEAGMLHNEFLDSVYIRTLSNSSCANLTESTFNSVKMYGVGFFSRRNYTNAQINKELIVINQHQHRLLQNKNLRNSNSDTLLPENLKIILDSFNLELLKFPSVIEFENKVNQIYNNCINQNIYTQSEKESIALMAGVAIASCKYWIENAENWKSKKKIDPSTKGKIADLVVSDVGGIALGGAFGMALCSAVVAWSWD